MTVDKIKQMFPSLTNKEIEEALKIAENTKKILEPFSSNEYNCGTTVSEDGTSLERVNHPSHYTWLKDKCGIEVIDITRHLDFCIGNAVKYLLRAGHKSEEGYSDIAKTIEDLKKAVWYINDKINSLEKGLES